MYIGGDSSDNLIGRLDSWAFFEELPTDLDIDELYNSGNGKAYEILPIDLKRKLIGQFDFDELLGSRNSKGVKSYSATNYPLVVGGEVTSSTGLVQPYKDENVEVLGAFINGDGNTEIAIPWRIRTDSFIYVSVGYKKYTEYVSDTVTPDTWFEKTNYNNIILKGDLISGSDPIVIVSLEGVAPPSAAIRINNGLKPKNESYGNTTNLSSSTNVTSVNVVGGKTHITFSFQINPNNLKILYVDNEFWPEFKPSAINEKYFKLVGPNTIELDDDYFNENFNFYFSEFFEKSKRDENGNVIIPLTPYFRTFGLASPNLSTWAIGVDSDGVISTNDLYDIIPEPIRFRRDDSTICAIEIDNNGDLSVDDNPVGGGILFDDMYFESPDGGIWSLGITNDNKLYTEDKNGQKFVIKNTDGSITYQIINSEDGAVLTKSYFPEGVLPPKPILNENNETSFAFVKVNNVEVLHFYNPVKEKWEVSNIALGGAYEIGETVESVRTLNNFRNEYGPYWYPLDGTVRLPVVNFQEFAELVDPQWIDQDTNEIVLPDLINYDYGANYLRNNRATYPVLDGWNTSDRWVWLGSWRRKYWQTDLDSGDTTVNDVEWNNPNEVFHDIRTFGSNGGQRQAARGNLFFVYRRRNINKYIRVK